MYVTYIGVLVLAALVARGHAAEPRRSGAPLSKITTLGSSSFMLEPRSAGAAEFAELHPGRSGRVRACKAKVAAGR